MSHTYRGPTREQHRRTIRRLRQQDRNRAQSQSMVQPDDLTELKRIKLLWEQSIDFFANSSGNIDSAKEDNDGQVK